MKVGIYCRVSKDKDGKDRSLPFQTKDGQDFAETNGYLYEIYSEKEGTSGTLTTEYRPQLLRLLNDVTAGKLQAIYAYDISRFERNDNDRYVIFKTLNDAKAKLFTNRDGFIDFTKPEIKLQLDIISATNGYMVALTKIKVTDTLHDNIIEGRVHSSPAFGYMADENKLLVVNPETSKIVKRIFDLSIGGNGGQTIAKTLSAEGIPTPTTHVGGKTLRYKTRNLLEPITVRKQGLKWNAATVNRILNNRLYIGERKWNDEIFKVPAIITSDIFEQSQAAIQKNKNNGENNSTHQYLLKGLIKCAKCGNNYHGYTQTKRGVSVYMCYNRRIVNNTNSERCTNKRIDRAQVDELIWQNVVGNPMFLKILKEDFDFDNDSNLKESLQIKHDNLVKDLNKIEATRQNIINLCARGIIEDSDLEIQLSTLNNEKKEIELLFTKVKKQLANIENQNEIIGEVRKFQERFSDFENADFETKRKIVSIFIDNIMIDYNSERKLSSLDIKLHLNLEHHSLEHNILMMKPSKSDTTVFEREYMKKLTKGATATHLPRFP